MHGISSGRAIAPRSLATWWRWDQDDGDGENDSYMGFYPSVLGDFVGSSVFFFLSLSNFGFVFSQNQLKAWALGQEIRGLRQFW